VGRAASGRPVKLRLDRDDDFMIHREAPLLPLRVRRRFDDEASFAARRSRWSRGPAFPRTSPAPSARAQCVPLRQRLLSCRRRHPGRCRKTNTQSNTAFRGFGGPQARSRSSICSTTSPRARPRSARRAQANFYGKRERNVTPYGMTVEDNVIHELVAELEASSTIAGAASNSAPTMQRARF